MEAREPSFLVASIRAKVVLQCLAAYSAPHRVPQCLAYEADNVAIRIVTWVRIREGQLHARQDFARSLQRSQQQVADFWRQILHATQQHLAPLRSAQDVAGWHEVS